MSIYKVPDFSIIHFLFSLFINIYVNKFNEKDVKKFSVTNQLNNRKLNLNRRYHKINKFNFIIHNLQLPITITQFGGINATFLMMIVHLLPYLKDIDKISPIIDYLLPKLKIEHEEEYYMLLVLMIIIQKRTLEQQQPDMKKTGIELINKLKNFIRKYSIHKYNVLLIIGYDSDYLIKKQTAQIIFRPIIKNLDEDEYNGNNPYLNLITEPIRNYSYNKMNNRTTSLHNKISETELIQIPEKEQEFMVLKDIYRYVFNSTIKLLKNELGESKKKNPNCLRFWIDIFLILIKI